MKKKFFVFIVASVSAAGLFSCGAKCKTCYAELMGVKSPEQELCGDQLKQAEKTPNMVCK